VYVPIRTGTLYANTTEPEVPSNIRTLQYIGSSVVFPILAGHLFLDKPPEKNLSKCLLDGNKKPKIESKILC
jgi:hypothetical protein